MDMNKCKKNNLVKLVKPDMNKIQALLKSAENKVKACDILPDSLGESKVSLIYDGIRMVLEYLALKEGYKIYNHECYTAFLKEVMKESRLGDEFDRFRKVRNGINYYGEEISNEEAKELVIQMKKFFNRIKP
ncbi:hypothetical protein J4477_03670 [Candidatus Pacearchaeota archaeon]|nr:hypothetical protein [Candidatus Pacearchaeota archaeon]